jgi:hypothetical protein
MEVEMGLLVSFPDQSEVFVLGFEAGQIWERLSAGNFEEVTVHTVNSEVIMRMARHFRLNTHIEATGVDGWSVASFTRSRPVLLVVPK